MKIRSMFRKCIWSKLLAFIISVNLFSCKKAEIQDNVINSFSRFGSNTTISKVIAGNSNTAKPVFWAFVTASGAAQNASGMIWLQDETAGIAIKLKENQSTRFVPGTLVLVQTDGLKVKREGSFYLLGLPEGDNIKALSETELADYVTVAAQEQLVGIPQITLDQVDASYNQRVVTISDIEVVDEHLTGNFGSDTEQEKAVVFQDCSGNEITLVTNIDAELAPIAIKTGHGNLTGLVTLNNGVKQIRLLDAAAADVLKGARCTYLQYADKKYFVTPNGNVLNDGKSWATAKSLEAAIAAAVSGDSIFVAKGTYAAVSGNALISLSAANDGIRLYGGFAGTETSLKQRVFGTTAADSTILEGNNNRVIFNNATPALPITDIIYDGFTITNGLATGSTSGGGMYNYYASVTVNNCIFKDNRSGGSGGGMYNTYNTITVSNCKFYGNIADANGGGALLASTGSNAVIDNCVFDSNAATHTSSGIGGGVSTYSDAVPTTVTVTNSTFNRNSSASRGGGMFNSRNVTTTISGCTFTNNTAVNGAGMYNNTDSAPNISNCTFTGNIATTYGGGMYNFTNSAPDISNCTFTSNEANSAASTTGTGGGGLYSVDANPTIIYCVFLGNKAANGGGVNISNAGTLKFINCLLAGNKANNAGGAAYITNTAGKTCTPTFINSTIAGNNANTGGGMYNTGTASSNGTNAVITNCIIYGNTTGIINSAAAGATATVTYSNVQYTGGSETNYASGTGNINANPLFVSSPAYSTAPFTGGNYALQGGSPAINAGNNSAINGYATDLAGNPRIKNTTVDMGAYEYQN